MRAIGKLDWAFAAGRIPFISTGEEPEFIGHDKISVLNTSGEEAVLELFIFYEDVSPVGSYEIKVKPNRLRKIRLNDLIDPEAMQLERNYSCYIRTNVRVVVQFSRQNTGSRAGAEMSTMAFAADT